jgi:peptidoglycan/xylan/chitin deacetylase (PgdA/CDA1 family)
MFFGVGLNGNDLPPKTVCLTFDDGPGETQGSGPGPRTVELAQFLSERSIQATFFAVGEFAAGRRESVQAVAGMGHTIGNHTYSHPRLSGESGNFAADQIRKTDDVISGIPGTAMYFRPPYGDWSPDVAGQLNWTEASRFIGPILWDIDAADWRFWLLGKTAQECAAAYIEKIRSAGGGLVLLHDGSVRAEIRSQHRTFEAVRLIVAWLEENGHTCVRLDSLPQVREAARVSSVMALRTETLQYLSPQGGGGGEVLSNAATIGGWEPLGVVELGDDRIALRCLSGHYITFQNSGANTLLANASSIGDAEVFTRVELGADAIALRCCNGKYVRSNGKDGEVLADGLASSAGRFLRVSHAGPTRREEEQCRS